MAIGSWFENINFSNCIWFGNGSKRNSIMAMLSGTLFFTGWWLIIDAMYVHPDDMNAAYHICGIMATVSMFMINIISSDHLSGENYDGGWMGATSTRVWMFIGFVLGFASVIASFWIFSADFAGDDGVQTSVGVSLLLQNILIFASSLLFKFGRIEEY